MNQRNQQSVNVQRLPAQRPTGAVISGFEGYYDDAEDRRVVAVAQPAQLARPAVQPERPPLLANVQPAATTIVQTKDDELTRAKATVIFSAPLAIALALVITAAVITLSGTPVLSAITLITFFSVFAVAWGSAIGFFVARSPAGTAYMHTRRLWNVVDREQAHRHEVEWYLLEREDRSYE